VTGPYIGNKANPVLTHRHLGHGADIVGVGHADLVQAVDGTWWSVLLAMRPYGGYHYNLGRETFLVPLSWEEGWPVFAPGQGRVPCSVEVPFAVQHSPGVMQGEMAGVIAPDDPRWTTPRAQPEQVAQREDSGWSLPLASAGPADVAGTAFLGVRQQHRNVDVVAIVSADLQDGEEAGIVIRQSERDHVRVSMSAAPQGIRFVATHRQAAKDSIIGEVALKGAPAGEVQFRVRARGQDYELSVGAPGEKSVVVAIADGRTLDSVATGGFLGLWIGVYATSNGVETDTALQLRRFEYSPS